MARPPLGRQQLLDAARDELVAGGGFLELAALGRRTGLSTGAIYHHFGSKSGLLAAVYIGFYNGLQHAVADARLSVDDDWAARERQRTGHFVDYHYADSLAPIVLSRSASDPQLAELDATYIDDISAHAAENIRRGQQTGEISADINADDAGAYVIGGLRHGLARQLLATPPIGREQAAEQLWRFTAGALGLRSRGLETGRPRHDTASHSPSDSDAIRG